MTAVKRAKKSVMFCMFSPTDPALITALLATSDRERLLFGLLNTISDPTKRGNDNLSVSGEAPRELSDAAKVQITLFNRSGTEKKALAYSYSRPGNAPTSFLPELHAVDFSSRQTMPAPHGTVR